MHVAEDEQLLAEKTSEPCLLLEKDKKTSEHGLLGMPFWAMTTIPAAAAAAMIIEHGDICSSKDVINHISGGENERERRAELRFYPSPWEHGYFTQHPATDPLKAVHDFFSCNTSSSNGAGR